MSLSADTLERCFTELLASAHALPLVEKELRAARAGFATMPEDPQSERRYAEWFLLERYSEALADVPVRALAAEIAGRGPEMEHACRALAASFVGVFAVTSVAAGDGVWVRDLVGLGEYPLEEAEGSFALQPGDVIVGRIFPTGDTLYRVSPCAGVFRAPRLVPAIESDMQRARTGHRGTLRLSQRELEAMFFAAVPTLDTGVDVRAVHERACAELDAAGLDAKAARRLVDALAALPLDRRALVLGTPGDALGRLLEEIAFETEADLDACRRALVRAWPVLAPAANKPATRKQKTSMEDALASFDRGRKAGRDLEELFGELERDLALEPGESESGADEPAPDFPGVVGAMVDEFLWDLAREQGRAAAARYQSLALFARFGASYGVFENLRARDLVLYLAVWLPEQGVLRTPDDAHAAVDALRAFCAWAEEWHAVPLESALGSTWSSLRSDLARLTPLNAGLEQRPQRPQRAGRAQLVEYLGAGRVRDAHGAEKNLALEPAALQALHPGDRLRVAAEKGDTLRALRCYPPPSAELLLEPRAARS